MKDPKCTICGGAHYKTFCFQTQRKPLMAKSQFKPVRASFKRKTGYSSFTAKTGVRRPALSAYGKSERSKLVREADRVFSIYIRAKDAVGGTARCVTCGGVGHWKLMHNGHYLSRRIVATRWNQINCNVQCEYCNVTLHGNLTKYKEYLISRYGEGIEDYLRQKVRDKGKTTDAEIKDIIETYKIRIAELT